MLTLSCCFLQLQAGDVNPYHMGEDTNWYYHYNFEASNNSELAQEFKPELDELFSRVKEFDLIDLKPNEDLLGFTLYGNHVKKKTVAILEGQFSPSLIYAIRQSKTQAEKVNGLKVYSFKKHFTTILNDQYIVSANSKDHLLEAVQVIQGTAAHLNIENELLEPYALASLAITDINLAQEQLKKFKKNMAFNLPLEKISFTVKDNGNSLSSQLKILSEEKVTDSLVKLSSGYLGLAQTYVRKAPALQSIFKAIEVEGEGQIFTMSFDVKNDEIRPHLAKALEKAKNYQQKKSQD